MEDKLAMMQADAAAVEQGRKDRVKQHQEKDALEEDELMNRSLDGGHKFVADLHRKTGDLSLGERMGRSRANYNGDSL